MRSRRIVGAAAAALLLAPGCGPSAAAPLDDEADDGWSSFTLSELRARLPSQGVRFTTGVESSTFRVGLLRTPVGDEVGPALHRLNVVYVVFAGSGTLTTEDGEWTLGEGSVAFVRGDIEHRIVDVRSDLELLVAFREETLATNVDPAVVVFEPDESAPIRNAERSTWRPLLSTSNVDLGTYMVPKGMDPDVLMAHGVDELKIVIDGEARFDIGLSGLSVAPGSVAFIENRVPHRFRRVAETLRVLVVFAR